MVLWKTLERISSEEETKIGEYFELYGKMDLFYTKAIKRSVNKHKEIELNELVGGKDIKYLLSKVGSHFLLDIQCEPGLMEVDFLGGTVDKIQYSISSKFDQASIYAHTDTDTSATVTPKVDPASFWTEIEALNTLGMDRLEELTNR